ncbi:MAG: L,D-transpeptidase [Rhodoferax sp.]
MKMSCSVTLVRHAIVLLTLAWCCVVNAQVSVAEFAMKAVTTGNTAGKVFAVIDKVAATVSLFDAAGNFVAASPVLVGRAIGDQSVPGIGERPMNAIAPHERTTPAGRFDSEPGINLSGEALVWIDYDAAVSMHRLRPAHTDEKRPQRMASPSPADNRITYGCVNVPVAFYLQWVLPTLGTIPGVIYVLPETQPAKQVFPFLS